MRRILFSAACLLALAASPAQALVVGAPADPVTGNEYPFGSPYNAEYQQVYTSSLFSGPITITSLEFYNTQYDSGATSLPTGTWDISLSTTSADWNSLSATMGSNIGGDVTTVFSGDISQAWAGGNTLVITLASPFTYDPTNGNLLMDVVGSGITSPGGIGIFFDTNGFADGSFDGNTIFGRVYYPGGDPSGLPVVDNGYGLVTGFNEPVGSVPEPLTLSLFGAGLAGAAAMRRRKTKAA